MRKSQILATASVIALSTAAALPMSAIFTNPARADITIDWTFGAPADLQIGAGTTSAAIATELENTNSGVIAATVLNSVISNPISGIQDYGGGTDNVPVTSNVASSTAIGTQGTTFIDLFVVTGPGTTGGGVTGAAEINRGLTSIDSKVSAVDIRAASEDLGAGSSQPVDFNLIQASTSGNIADSTLSGNINVLLTSTEDGKAAVSQGSNKFLTASGTLMVGNMQINDNLSSFTAGIDTTRIGSIAIVNDDTTAIDGIALSIQENTINAQIEGNNADNLINVTDGKDVILEGAVGVINAQLNSTDAMVIKASVISSDIEAGDTTTILDPIDNLDGSSVDFSSNSITASATASTGTNTLKVDGVSIDGSFTAATKQDHTINTNAGNVEGHTRALADVYIASLQFNEATVTSSIGGATGDLEDGDLNVLVENVVGSSVQAGDDKLLGKDNDGIFDGNVIYTAAHGNEIDNLIDIGDIASYSALTGLGSTQNTDGGNQQLASTNGDLVVSVATLGGSTGIIDASSIVADGNIIGSEAVTNTGSNAISLDATTITGPGIDPDEANEGFMARSWHSNLVASATTDIALVSNQQVENSTVGSKSIGSIQVQAADVSGALGTVDDSSVSVSGNGVSALTQGNVIGENLVEADATTFAASVALVSFQVVQDNAGAGSISMSATVAPSDDDTDIAIVDVTSSALTTTDAKFDVDSNSISAQVYGNLVLGDTNAIRISGVTVGDNDMGARTAAGSTADVSIGAVEAVVDRNIESDDLPQTTVNSGFALISDQSFEDSGTNPVIASITGDATDGDAIDLNIGFADPAAIVSGVKASADDNDITARVRLNSASNAIDVGAETLDANITLVNTQSFWDEFGAPDGAGIVQVDINDAEIDVNVDAGDGTIDNINVTANGNATLGEARISGATNVIDVSAQTQVVTGIIAGADVQSVNIADDKSVVRAEVGLVNDQDFNGLMSTIGGPADSGISVEVDESDIFVTVSTTSGSLIDSTVEADKNSIRALALGNDATNVLSLDIGTVNLDDALIGGAAGNAPLAIISNAQRGSDADTYEAGFWAELDDNYIEVDLSGIDIEMSSVQASVDGNLQEATARVNNGRNVLSVTGGTYEPVSATTPLVQAQNIVGGGEVAAEDLAFGIASYQTNGYDVEAFGEDTNFTVDVSGGVEIDSSKFSVSDNVFLIQARSNDNINDASVTFTENNVSAFVANVQKPGADTLEIDATGEDIEFSVEGFDSDATDSSVDVDGNKVSVIGTANRALLNTLSIDGTNLLSGTGATPSAQIDPAGAIADVSVVSDASVMNVQGEDSVGSGFDEEIFVYGEDIDFFVDFDVFSSGSVSIDNNTVLTQGIIHSANNLLGMGASYVRNETTGAISLVATDNVANVSASGSIISQQIVTDDSEVFVQGEDTDLQIDIVDISGADAVSLSVSKNDVINEGIGGTVLNRMDVLAGATITGSVGSPTPEIGDLSAGNPLVANADFNIVNYQAGEPEVFAFGEDTEMSIEVQSDAVGDTLTVSANELSTRATGFNASNILVLNADASSDATANVVNRQDIANTTVEALQDEGDDETQLFIDLLGNGSTSSSITLDDNVMSSTANGNVALNAISTTAGATLQESSGAGITVDPAGPVFMAPTNSDYSVLNYQSFTDATAESTVNDASIYIDGLSGATGVDTSSLSVSDNKVLAASTANRSENYLVLNTGTFQHPSATIGNLQTTSGANVTATASNISIGIGNGDNIGSTSSNSSLQVRGNQIGSTAIGNSSVGSITGGN